MKKSTYYSIGVVTLLLSALISCQPATAENKVVASTYGEYCKQYQGYQVCLTWQVIRADGVYKIIKHEVVR